MQAFKINFLGIFNNHSNFTGNFFMTMFNLYRVFSTYNTIYQTHKHPKFLLHKKIIPGLYREQKGNYKITPEKSDKI